MTHPNTYWWDRWQSWIPTFGLSLIIMVIGLAFIKTMSVAGTDIPTTMYIGTGGIMMLLIVFTTLLLWPQIR